MDKHRPCELQYPYIIYTYIELVASTLKKRLQKSVSDLNRLLYSEFDCIWNILYVRMPIYLIV